MVFLAHMPPILPRDPESTGVRRRLQITSKAVELKHTFRTLVSDNPLAVSIHFNKFLQVNLRPVKYYPMSELFATHILETSSHRNDCYRRPFVTWALASAAPVRWSAFQK